MDFHNRQYDPQLGRFLGVDALAGSGGQQVLSPYHAMGCNPALMVEPLGLRSSVFDNGARPIDNTPRVSQIIPMNTNARYILLDQIMYADQAAFHQKIRDDMEAEAEGEQAADVLSTYNSLLAKYGGQSSSGTGEVLHNGGYVRLWGMDMQLPGLYIDVAANQILATNLPKKPSKDIDPVSEQFHKDVNDFFLSITPILGLVNQASKIITGKNLQGNSYAPGDPLQAMGSGPIKGVKVGLPAKVFSSKAPVQVTPGVTKLSGQYINDLGVIQPWKATYDKFGRLIERTDWNAANKAYGIDAIHHHIYQYLPKTQIKSIDHIPGVGPQTGW